jgi:amino acid transporter
MRKIVLRFGLIAGLILSSTMLLALVFQDQIGFDKGAIVGYSSMVVAFLMVYFGVQAYRDQLSGGSVGFGRAFLVGLAITAVACVCYVVTWEFVFFVLAPDFLDKYAAYALDQARLAGASEAQIAVKTQEMAEFMQMYRNPLFNMAITLIEPLPVGLLFTLVSAGLLSRQRPAAGALPARQASGLDAGESGQ